MLRLNKRCLREVRQALRKSFRDWDLHFSAHIDPRIGDLMKRDFMGAFEGGAFKTTLQLLQERRKD